MQFYGDIVRIDEEQRMVWGYAGTEARAADGMIITRDALAAALDDYMKFANVREMHQPSAVGITREGAVDDTGLYIGANIVDDVAWDKVKRKVYKGFSIGGKATERDTIDRSIVRGLTINEISLVDRPADPGAVFDIWRAAGTTEQDMTAKPAKTAASKEAAKPITSIVSGVVEVERAAPAETAAAKPAAEVEPVTVERASNPANVASEGGETASTAASDASAAATDDPVARAIEAAAAAAVNATQAVQKVERVLSPERADLPGAEIRRGMSTVSRLGYLLSELSYVVFDSAYEAAIEEDNSRVPAKLRTALAALVEAYRDMSNEEVAELLATVDAVIVVESATIAFAAAAGDIQRAEGLTLTPELSAKIVDTQKLLIERGWLPKPDAAADGAEASADITRVTGERDKALADNDTLLRALTESTENTTKLVTRVDGLSAEIERMKQLAAPPKTAASAAVAVSKEQDASGNGIDRAAGPELTTKDVQRALADMTPDERNLAITRAALAKPIPITR